MLLLIGPAVAVIGIVAVVFVMRHKSVEKRSMYSSRRSQIEHKVRAARQRTLAPGRHAEKADKTNFEESAAPAPALTYETSAYAAPPVAPPPMRGRAAPAQPAWESEPVASPASPPAFEPPPPAYEAPPYEAPAYQPPAAEPPAWTPTAPVPESTMPPAQEAATPAAAGAAWSVVGETKASAEPEPDKKKKPKQDPGGAWSLASGELAGDEADSGPKKPSAAIAVAQYAVLVVGLVMVLIGVVVMVANSHPS
jgi:uncharacterized integral membrane protein